MANEKPKKYVHKPDKHEAEGDELFCFINDIRLCNGACVAYDIHGAGDDKRTSCILINAQMQQSTTLLSLFKLVRSKERSNIPGSDIPPPR